MAGVVPFRGLRYVAGRVGDIGTVIAPPFDVITPEVQAALHERSPYNVVRLEYGLTEPSDSDTKNRYTRAAAALSQWTRDTILVPDEQPCFYLYQQDFDHGGKQYIRRALIARVRLEEWGASVIRPHEYTLDRPKDDRLRLLRACRTQISPVFALYRDDDGAIVSLAEQAADETAVDATDSLGHRHSLRLIADTDAQATLARLFADKTLYIADGHHRYETALAYRAERRAQASSWTGDEPENYVMMGLVAVDDPGLLVLPIHRLVRKQQPPDLWQKLSADFIVTRGELDDVEPFLAALAEAGKDETALGMCVAGAHGLYTLTAADAEEIYALMPRESPLSWRQLDVNVLQYGILGPILGIEAEHIAKGDVLEFTEDVVEAVFAVHEGHYSIAFLMNATRPHEVLAVADAGWRMPQKSTFFYPKLGTGLVLNPLDI